MLCQPCCGGGAGVDVDVDLVALVRGGDEHVLPAVVAADDWRGGVPGVEHLRHFSSDMRDEKIRQPSQVDRN